MSKQIPAILLTIISIVLAVLLYTSNQETQKLKNEIAQLKDSIQAKELSLANEPVAESVPSQPHVELATANDSSNPDATNEAAVAENESSGRRMMASIAKMMDNPTMNKVMEASQRGAIGALYSDFIEFANLNAEETKYFMDLLMVRQMKNVDLGMKMMSGALSDEEKEKMGKEIKEAGDMVKEEMEKFLNNPEDFAEWEFYEKTMGERMMLSQMDQSLAGSDAALSDETYRDLLGIMSEERNNFDFSGDLHDQENMDLSAERFTDENVQSFITETERLNDNIIEKASSILSPEQLEAFISALKVSAEMQKAQMEMVKQMFGGSDKPNQSSSEAPAQAQ